ncbi:nucleotidyltransferase [Luteimonas marina]|uniref:Nucleotidyltransferase n=1 Tax=Luteimonas marina TaxID=488485 RepID=A0A5C5U312_9GAMM|nr:nucleotidyltransferase domain-containing protein [Luteimonas marina]TWT20316.1 nucleotidyltransferase [Luteimonas marina]
MSDEYLRQVLLRHAVDYGPASPVRRVQLALMPTIHQWGGQQIIQIAPSGSFAKGTAVHSGTDIDLFVSLSSTTNETLAQIYNTLFNALAAAGVQPQRQNVAIKVRVNGYDVDVVPGKRQSQFGDDHSLYSNRSGTWLQTNVARHVNLVSGSNRLAEIRLLKIWRNRRGLDFPSFYLELVVLRALNGQRIGNLSHNVFTVLQFIRDHITTARFVDPANTNNVISDSVSAAGKQSLANAARAALTSTWGNEFA